MFGRTGAAGLKKIMTRRTRLSKANEVVYCLATSLITAMPPTFLAFFS